MVRSFTGNQPMSAIGIVILSSSMLLFGLSAFLDDMAEDNDNQIDIVCLLTTSRYYVPTNMNHFPAR